MYTERLMQQFWFATHLWRKQPRPALAHSRGMPEVDHEHRNSVRPVVTGDSNQNSPKFGSY